MAASTQSAVATHALTFLARWAEELQSSERIAQSLKSNPVVMRRILGRLREASLVAATEGRGGGWRLARPPERITLFDVYTAVEQGRVLPLHAHPPSEECVIGRHVQDLIDAEFSAAEQAMEQRLSRATIADMLAGVLEREREMSAARSS